MMNKCCGNCIRCELEAYASGCGTCLLTYELVSASDEGCDDWKGYEED